MDELFIVINEIDTHVVAIKGSNKFPITNSVAANVRLSPLFKKT